MFKKIAAATALLIASTAAFAAQPNTFYAGADIGRTDIDGIRDRATSYGAFAGYNFHQNFAVEGGYRVLADKDWKSGAVRASGKVDQLSLSVIGSLPVSESFSVYGRLGVNRLETRISLDDVRGKGSETKALYGVGVSYALTPTVSTRLEVQKPASGATNLSAGVAFRF